MAITEDEARKVAHLARIAVDDADLPALAQLRGLQYPVTLRPRVTLRS